MVTLGTFKRNWKILFTTIDEYGELSDYPKFRLYESLQERSNINAFLCSRSSIPGKKTPINNQYLNWLQLLQNLQFEVFYRRANDKTVPHLNNCTKVALFQHQRKTRQAYPSLMNFQKKFIKASSGKST